MTITFFEIKILAKRKAILSTICIGTILYSFPTFSKEKPLEEGQVIIEGDTLENILDRKLRATGNAILIRDNKSITANQIEYDQISDELYAAGMYDTPLLAGGHHIYQGVGRVVGARLTYDF